MRLTGIVLIVVGICMFIFSSINFKTEKTIVDAGPLKINKEENNRIGWPAYVGGIVVLAGVVLVVADRKKS